MRNVNSKNKTSNHLPKSDNFCNFAKYLAVGTLAKISQVCVFHRVPTANVQSK